MKRNAIVAAENWMPLVKPPYEVDEVASHDKSKDHFVEKDGLCYAGAHLLLDFWGAKHLSDLKLMEYALRKCVAQCQATLLHIHLHHFTPNGGISGVAILAESHISVHTWPERDFAAFDIFMCGDAKPENAIFVLKELFLPQKTLLQKNLRGNCKP